MVGNGRKLVPTGDDAEMAGKPCAPTLTLCCTWWCEWSRTLQVSGGVMTRGEARIASTGNDTGGPDGPFTRFLFFCCPRVPVFPVEILLPDQLASSGDASAAAPPCFALNSFGEQP